MKMKQDKLEDTFTVPVGSYYRDGKKIVKTRPGKKEDFLMEIKYGDSVIIDVQGDSIRKINPNDIIEEIGKYIKEGDKNHTKSKKIQTAMKFFNGSKEQISSEYIQNFFRFVKDKESQRNGEKPIDKIENYKEHFAKVLTRYLNKEKHYVHKENDIDKSSLMFLLDKFGIDLKNKIQEINHEDIEKMNSWVYWDVGETANGIKIIEKITGKNKKWKETKKTKKIISEHTDASDAAILTNRPSSTTQMIFKIAKELWVIDKEQLPQIERFVNFVNTVDSMDYQISSIDYKHNYQTVFGLYRSMNIEDIFEYFKNSEHNGFEKLPEWYMKKTKTITRDGRKSDIVLQEISEKHKERIEKNIDNFEKIKDSGKELVYGNTKFIVDIEEKTENRIQDGPQTSWYNGYGFFNIKVERGNIYIYSPKKFPVTIEWFPTDWHFLIINNPTEEDLEKLFQKFSTENSTLKKDIIKRLSTIQAKKEEPINENDFSSKCKLFLPELIKKDLKIGKKYTAIINNDPQNKIAFCTLDSKERIKGRIKVEDKNLLKGYKKWSTIHVKIDEIPEEDWKLLSLSLVV